MVVTIWWMYVGTNVVLPDISPEKAFETQLINYFHSHIIQGTWGKFAEGNMAKRPLLNGVASVMRDTTCSTWGRLISVRLWLQIPPEAVPAIKVGSILLRKSLI